MTVQRMGLTYPEVGATAGELPAGYHHLRRSRVVGAGRDCFAAAGQRILEWDMHRRAGIDVEATTPPAASGLVVGMRLGLGRVGVTARCRVVEIIDTPRERGFAYGTLAGHPEIGEERFWVQLRDDDTVVAHVVGFSRPGKWFTRIGGPVGRLVQSRITDRYLDALMCP
ncbi:DUF1990 domain-containing protein [Gordonia sp. zg691]|uniref:DUF1990 family protein n=1 Tax=Gordonia jinghuaiqii TaxID=2758710 RepID=UPI0016627023|nr:DUF1990 domain-containing protein [Gordonia jinghuaiqii]MBD0860139.1 DUF1990 domain-containing protein [Gordonia jinghuaiqii]